MREDVSFAGDAVPPDGPPFAWVVLLWDGYYASVYRGYVPESLRRWGRRTWFGIRCRNWRRRSKTNVAGSLQYGYLGTQLVTYDGVEVPRATGHTHRKTLARV